jgi:hypothetical protein
MKTRLTFAILVTALSFGPVLASEQSDVLKTFCKSDIRKFCKGVPMSGVTIFMCLKEHDKQMSDGCAEALKKLKE